MKAFLVAALLGVVSQCQAKTTEADLNKWLVDAEYAVRGAILDRAMELKKTLKDSPGSLPFDKIIACNIGNPQSLGQKPLTYNRQVLSIVTNPTLLDTPAVKASFPADVVERAESYIAKLGGGVGAYSNSQGVDFVREEVAEFIANRDGFPASAEDIFLTDGASAGVRATYTTMIDSLSGMDGMLVPIPQYPLYSALTTLHNAQLVPYYLDESAGWKLTVTELKRAITEAKAKGIRVRALAIINPGNPTGQCLDEKSMTEVVKFCADNNVVLLADEVYQENVYTQAHGFVSFKKVVMTMATSGSAEDKLAANTLEMISYHSISKGFLGECGIRGGYYELYNLAPEVKANMYKLASISLCANTIGQLGVGLMVKPPAAGSASAALYNTEKSAILSSLKRRAKIVGTALNKLEGVSCQDLEGAMYAFPSITIPPLAFAAAEKAGLKPDAFFAMEMVENTGIVVVPGSGFGQVDGSWHIRTTFLPPEDTMADTMERFSAYHKLFMAKYSGKAEL